MLRWKHMVLARALSSWNDHVKYSLHEARILELITLRMRIAGMYKARASWLTWYEVCALSKCNAWKVYKIVIRWEKIKYVKTFGTWQEQTNVQRKLRVAATKAVKRWTNKALALVWGRWWGEVRRSRVVKKVALRMRSTGMYKVWNSWSDIATELRRQRTLLGKKEIRVQRAGMHKAWASWFMNAAEFRRQRSLIHRMALRVRSSAVFKAWLSWGDNAADLRRRRALLKETAHRMRSVGMYKAWASWRGNCDALCRMNALHMRSVKRMHKRRTAVSLRIWLQNSKEQIRMETECTKIKMRMANRGIALMFLTWYAHSTETARLEKMCRKLVVRMPSHMICLIKSLNRWGATMVELRRQRRVLSTVAARMRYACVYAALASWMDINKGRRRRWDVLRKILNRMISEMFLTWCIA
jgi:hypothetical protein